MTPDLRTAVVESLKRGHTVNAIAVWFGLTWQEVAGVRASTPDINRRMHTRVPQDVRAKVLDLYEGGWRLKDIAAATGIKVSTVGTLIHKARNTVGLKRKGRAA